MNLNIKPKKDCKYDEVSLGEIMLRLDPGEGRLKVMISDFLPWPCKQRGVTGYAE